MTNTKNTPIEALERTFPLRVLRYRLPPGENWLLPQGDEDRAERLSDKCTIRLQSGDVLRILTPGGGGWGPPPVTPVG